MSSGPDIAGRLAAAGIGYAGIDGAWWLPAAAPAVLPRALAGELREAGQAIFALFDAAADLYETSPDVRAVLSRSVPPRLLTLLAAGPVLSLRPDFQLCPQPGGSLRPVATELEICPATQGFAHAMQTAYGLPADLADTFAAFLDGRELWFAGTSAWSEFLIEQLAFCRALAERGARARVLFDLPLSQMAAEFRAGRRWQPPMFGLPSRPAVWDDDLLRRLGARDLLRFAGPDDWPAHLGRAVIFRFGYLDGFSPEALARFADWERGGAVFLNPARYYLDSKAVMALVGLPEVRAGVSARGAGLTEALDRCLPETLLLTPELAGRLAAEQPDWVLKFAGFDSGQQAWGGRSLQIGLDQAPEAWRDVLARYAALPFPVVAQRLAPSLRYDADYIGPSGPGRMTAGHTRLRTFFLRSGPGAAVTACGSHLTVSAGTMQVSEAADSVQAPVVFD